MLLLVMSIEICITQHLVLYVMAMRWNLRETILYTTVTVMTNIYPQLVAIILL